MRMKKLLTLLMFIGTSVALKAQSGEISGKVTDENGEGVISGTVVVVDEKGNNTSVGTITDFDGNYSLKPLKPGSYNLRFSYVGYGPQVRRGVIVGADKTTTLDIKLSTSTDMKEVIVEYQKPLIEKASTTIDYTLDKKDIKNASTQSVGDLVSQSAGVFQQDANSGIQIRGSREGSAVYYVNGIKRFGTPKVPVQSVEQLTVIAGGIPARYGDATAGIINITTKGPASEYEGGISFQTSQGLDAYGYNQANANLMGPLVTKGKGADKHTVFGFSSSFEFLGQKDRSPAAGGVWQVKKDVLDDIKAAPLIKNPIGDNFYLKSQNLTFKDLYKTGARPNNDQQDYKGVLQFEISPAKGINLLLGGDFAYTRYHSNVQEYSLLNAENNPLYKQLNYTAFARFSHLVGDGKKKEGKSESSSTSAIQNIYYALQFDFQKNKQWYADETHGNKLFDYGYIGKFETERLENFEYSTKSIGGKSYEGFIMSGLTDNNVKFTPGTQNALGARFTEQYYQILGAQQAADGSYSLLGDARVGFTDNVGNISAHNALVNGDRATTVYDIWYNIGRQYNGYGVDRNDEQYRARADVSFDIQKPGSTANKHSIEIGFEFEQRVQRAYSVNPLQLWDIAKTNVNKHLSLDTANPLFYVDGQRYTAAELDANNIAFNNTDTIRYGYTADAANQGAFDRHLRQRLGKSSTEWLDIYAVDPNQLSIDLFSANEVLSYGGGQYLTMRGYDYTGKVLNGNPTLDDFFKNKDADGNYLRQQGAFKPVYAAGYIQDKFTFKDLGVLIGVRVDRFDANQYVLRDRYSLYDIKTAGEVTTLNGVAVNRPDNIGDDYAVYVTKYGSGAQIAGYRKGDDWYDKYGNPSTGLAISNVGSEGALPYLNLPGIDTMSAATARGYVQSRPEEYDPNSSFVKYTPQYVVQPRLQVSFNITDKAQFFAHYDILSQRPQGRNQLNLAEYLYWVENGGYKTNPNLKPETTIDYEFGFKQVLSKTSVITLSAYYKEYRNLIQTRKIQYAFPNSYLTFDNIDFVSVKGLNAIYDMRRTGNFKFNLNYTLQFAEGTGSDDASQQYLTNTDIPNYRTIFPVDYDARHLINLNLDYRFGEGKEYNGPVAGNKQILANFGINAVIRARSGTPYSASGMSTNEASITPARQSTLTLNSSRLPWTFRVDLRINKDFAINVARKGEDKDPKKLYFSVYLWIQNLLNTKNVINVYRYTGNANDDGYLDAPQSQGSINSQENPQSFRDLYRAAVNNPANYSMPRRIYLGASFNF